MAISGETVCTCLSAPRGINYAVVTVVTSDMPILDHRLVITTYTICLRTTNLQKLFTQRLVLERYV